MGSSALFYSVSEKIKINEEKAHEDRLWREKIPRRVEVRLWDVAFQVLI